MTECVTEADYRCPLDSMPADVRAGQGLANPNRLPCNRSEGEDEALLHLL